MGDPAGAIDAWSDDLAAWAIPDEIRRQAARSPWEMPRQVFANRARQALSTPSGVSYERARHALPRNGTVLDVGCGAGAASLPLAVEGCHVTGVDSEPDMLFEFRSLADAAGLNVDALAGRWPDVSARAPVADVVVCHHVLYNVPDLAPFVLELTSHARRRVVIEVTARHPMSELNPLWESLHGLKRPDRPRAADALAAIRALGLDARSQSWSRPKQAEFGSYEQMIEVTGRRLCLPANRLSELDDALHDLGVDPSAPRLGGDRDLVTIWWPGAAIDDLASSSLERHAGT